MIRPTTLKILVLFLFLIGCLAGSPALAAGKVTAVGVPDGGKPVVAKADAMGTIHLVYDTETGPCYVKSADNGQSFSKPIAIAGRSSVTPGLEYNAWDMAIGKGGRVHVALGSNAWKLKLPQEEWGYFYAYLDPGAAAFSELRNINHKPSEGFSLAANDRGDVTACWLSDRLYVNVSRDNGDTFEPYVELDSHYNPCNCCTTSAAYGADGKLAILYREETRNERDMYLVLWDQRESTMTRGRISQTPWKVDACPMSYFQVARDGLGYVAVWPTKGLIHFAKLDANGEAALPLETKTPGFSGMRTGMIALSAPSGETLVAWKSAGQVGWQLYDAKGKPSGKPGSEPGPGNGVAGVLGKDGRFILFR